MYVCSVIVRPVFRLTFTRADLQLMVLTNQDAAEVIISYSSQPANAATIAPDDERTRLLRDQMRSELRVVRHGNLLHTLLRELLSRPGSRAYLL